MQVAVGMNNLHSFIPDSILHHDLKTKNVLVISIESLSNLNKVMDDWSIRISDFGLSRTSLMIGLNSSSELNVNSNGDASMKEDFRKTTAYIPSTAPGL